MDYVKGTITAEQVPEFIVFLEGMGYATRPGGSIFELSQVLLDGRFHAVTTNSRGVVGLPYDIACYVPEFFKRTQVAVTGITDTERLDFMLCKSRKVVVEIEGWGSGGRHYAVYVEEGFMSDKTYEAVRFTQEDDFNGVNPHGVKIKREAIDLAINETKGQTSEKSN